MKCAYYPFLFGYLLIKHEGDVIVQVRRVDYIDFDDEKSAFTDDIFSQLMDFMDGKTKQIKCKHLQKGTDFQEKVWSAVSKIPYGEVQTYGDIARIIGHPQAMRAVGTAMSKNKLMLIVPCHRVVSASGKLTGYGGCVQMQAHLINMEQQSK